MASEVYPQTTTTNTPTPQPIKNVQADSYSLLWKKATQDKRRTPLNELITFDWSRDDQSVGKFIEFVINLVTFNQSYAIDAFTLLGTAFEPYKQALANGTKVDYEKWEKISMKVHFSLNKIVSVLPLSSPSLADILIQKFPHTIHPLEVHHFFLKHVLLVTRYCPSISSKIIAAAVNTLVLIDTSITIEEIPGDDELQFDDFEGTGKSDSTNEQQEKNTINAQKLDGLMLLMFQYLDARFGKGKEGNIFVIGGINDAETSQMDEVFHSLVKAFDSSVLPTYKSKYTQFLLLYASRFQQFGSTFTPLDFNTTLLVAQSKPSQSPTRPQRWAAPGILMAESYIRYLCGKLANETVPSILRQSRLSKRRAARETPRTLPGSPRSVPKDLVLPIESVQNLLKECRQAVLRGVSASQSSKFVDGCYLHWSDVKKDDDDIDLEEMSDNEEEEEQDDNDKKKDDTDSEFDDFDEDDSDSESESDEDDSDDDESYTSEIDQLTEDFRSFTPNTGMPDVAQQHFKSRGFLN
ncbi:hypothetical protein PPL_04482 [Heterostelium album PN500]|uniref:Uncharacterized protein n=1 Tax=Heterostelium pallidum (strain ATCC 26659 / Pp 5 / PN500) TaxID=670386 RepID=D3B7P4_HETP5|nr:hypothetical protein PPL_04482 [Heterostelium album PN500]EFA82787.1 hypothetical protein PPL_04482 [Heterostelium album PN500]|eukprot:XP_020434904.1 hypothetical protein PPL_04482 [Heterostelium album PN500]